MLIRPTGRKQVKLRYTTSANKFIQIVWLYVYEQYVNAKEDDAYSICIHSATMTSIIHKILISSFCGNSAHVNDNFSRTKSSLV